MNHQKIYEEIINKAKSENRIKHIGIYYEEHHILPKCLNGLNNEENLVFLTAKEHFVCHKLLTYIHKGNRGISCAFHKMAFSKKHNQLVSARDYQYARELISLTPITDETRKKLSKALMGRPFAKKGIPISKEHKEKISKATSGENNGMYGKKHSKESLEKNHISNTGKKQSKETIEKRIKSNTGKKRSNETKEKMKKAWELRKINHPMTEETKKKIGIISKLRMTGKHHSKETIEKIRVGNLGVKRKKL